MSAHLLPISSRCDAGVWKWIVCGASFRGYNSWDAATEQWLPWLDVHVLHLGVCCGLAVVDEES
jgi:hypothetical protein